MKPIWIGGIVGLVLLVFVVKGLRWLERWEKRDAGDVSYASGACQKEERAVISGGMILVPVHIGERTCYFLLDTGAAYSFIDEAVASRLKLQRLPWFLRSESQAVVSDISFCGNRVGGVRMGFKKHEACEAMSESIRRPVVGSLGLNVLRRFVIDINYASQKVQFFGLDHRLEARQGVSIPFTAEHRPYIEGIGLRTLEGETIPMKAVVDTGTSAGFVCDPTILFTHFVSKTFSSSLNTPDNGKEGMEGNTGRLGAVVLPQGLGTIPSLHFVQTRQSRGDVLVLGWEILRNFRVGLDCHAGQLVLEPNRKLEAAKAFYYSGLCFGWRGKGYDSLYVRKVYPGSPGAKAGIMSGDEVMALNGRSSEKLAADGMELPDEAERVLTLSIRRNGGITDFVVSGEEY